MKNLKRVIVLMICAVTVFVFAGCSVGNGTNSNDLSLMIKTNFPTVVSIQAFDTATSSVRQGSGSGVIFYATPEYSLVATNAHVIGRWIGNAFHPYNYFNFISWSRDIYHGTLDTSDPNAMSPLVSTPRVKGGHIGVNGSRILYWNTEQDLAIVKYTPPIGFRDQAASLRTSALRVGEPVAAMGFSLGQFYRSSVGVVTQVFPLFKGKDESEKTKELLYGFMHDAITLQGNSGGPVFDATGKIIGLTTLTVMMCTTECTPTAHVIDAPALGFTVALSSRVIDDVFQSNKVAWGITQ